MNSKVQAVLYEIASPGFKVKIEGVELLGDSLSDSGGPYGMYGKKILGCIPLSLFLYKSPHKQFTNGFVWDYAFNEELAYLRKSHNSLENPNLLPVQGFFKSENRAQGGAMAYNYGGFLNFFRFIKGFFLSLALTNIQSEAKKLKRDKHNKLNPADLCIIFAGANDLVTAGYCDKAGAERAIQGVIKTIEILTSTEKKIDAKNYTKNILAFTLPDFSKTPRFSKKTEKEKKLAQEACHSFNEGLRKLAKSYQYIDFTFCDIYQEVKKEDIDLAKIKEKGIVITGWGSTRQVYFVDKGRFIFKDGKEISININLSKAEKKLLGKENGKIIRDTNVEGFENLIHKLTSKAKLNSDMRIFDAAAVFEKIDKNPEAYGFTSGCAVYYLSESEGEEVITNKIKSGNALIIQEINQKSELICYFVKDGKLIRKTDSYRLPETVRFKLSEKDKNILYKKLEEHPLEDCISKLVGCEDKHDLWTTHTVQAAVESY